VFTERLSVVDRMLLAFDAFVFSQVYGTVPAAGEIIHGREYRREQVPLAAIYRRVTAILEKISEQLAKPTAPGPVLNKHCAECQFAQRCKQIAEERDDLSLLSKMSQKERQRLHDRGIFTVTQLSHTFRHRRRASKKHDLALQVLAIRKNQIHVNGKIAWTALGTPVYIDVEGDPDRGFYYCVGIRFQSAGAVVRSSFWADDPAEEEKMWTECLATLRTIANPRLVHYGSFETAFLRQMRKRYPTAGSADFLDRTMESALNLLAVVYAQVYFPTYSNSLKDVAKYLGFSWSEPTASGLAALDWRRQWERVREPALKEKLLRYNAEDCAAAEIVARALSSLSLPDANAVDAARVKREYPQRFGENDFFLPEFEQINSAARWEHQRKKIYRQTCDPATAKGRSAMREPGESRG